MNITDADLYRTDIVNVSTAALRYRLARVEATPETERCDNQSDIRCCDDCGAFAIRTELEARGGNSE